MSDQQRRCYDEVSRAVTALVFDEPFYGHLLAGMNRRVTDTVGTAAVSVHAGRPLLVVNPDFFLGQLTRKKQRVAVVKHEVLHLLLKHVFRDDLASKNQTLFNLAADLVVNQLIGAKWELPESAITLDTFAHLKLPADQTIDWYYQRLLEHRLELVADGSAGFGNRGTAGTGETASEGDGAADTFEQLSAINALLSGGGPIGDYHPCDGWDQFNGTDSTIAARELGRLVLTARQRDQGRTWGLLPAIVRTSVDALIADLEPTVDWRRVLKIFGNTARSTSIKNTLKRPSKRYGTFPGTKVRRHQKLVVAIDTSGSISDDDLGDFFAEVKGLWRRGAEVMVVEADQAVQHVWSYQGGGPPDVVHGRTGTSFDPVFDWVREQRRRPDGVVYLTDGYAPEPEVDPGCPVLWVLTADGDQDNLGFGRIARIPTKT